MTQSISTDKMITRLYLLAAALLTGTVVSAQTTFKVSGTVTGLTDSCRVTLLENEGMKEKIFGSTAFKGEHFEFEAKSKAPCMAKLVFSTKNAKGNWVHRASLRLMTGNAPVNVSISKDDMLSDTYDVKKEACATVTCDRSQQEYKEYLDHMRQYERTADSLSYVEARAWFANNGDDSKLVNEKAAANAAKQVRDEESDKFMMTHPQYAISAALLAQKPYDAYSYSTTDFDRMYAALKDNPDTLHMNFIKRNLQQFRKLGTGSAYTDFDAKTKEDSIVKLSSLIKPGKMTLVDFWASWCGPCRNAIPKVKSILEAHVDDLQVISCSIDEKEEAWRKAEAEEKMPWPQLLIEKQTFQNVVAPAYMIMSIPKLMLLDKNGKILCITHDPMIINQKLNK